MLPVYDRRGKHLRPLKASQGSALDTSTQINHAHSTIVATNGIKHTTNGSNSSANGSSTSSSVICGGSSNGNSNKKSRVSSAGSNNVGGNGSGGNGSGSNGSGNKRRNTNNNGSVVGCLGGIHGGSGGGGLQLPLSGSIGGGGGNKVSGVNGGVMYAPHPGAVGPTHQMVHAPHGPTHGSTPNIAGGVIGNPLQEPPHAYIPNGELYFPSHYLEPAQSMGHMSQIAPCQKMLETPAYFMAGMKENTFHP